MNSKIIFITGSTDGIGKQTALELAATGARIIIHGRNEERCRQTVSFIRKTSGNEGIDYECADLSSQAEIRKLAARVENKYPVLDTLINNAGVYEPQKKLTIDGLEVTFAVNHLAYFLLTGLMLDLLRKSEQGRIINVSSMAHSSDIDFDNLQGEKFYSGSNAYAISKLANILFTFRLAKKLKNSRITVNCLHPGVINTKLLHAGWGMNGASVSLGAQTSVYLALSNEISRVTGKYFSNKRIARPSPVALDSAVQERLWEVSEDLCKYSYL